MSFSLCLSGILLISFPSTRLFKGLLITNNTYQEQAELSGSVMVVSLIHPTNCGEMSPLDEYNNIVTLTYLTL